MNVKVQLLITATLLVVPASFMLTLVAARTAEGETGREPRERSVRQTHDDRNRNRPLPPIRAPLQAGDLTEGPSGHRPSRTEGRAVQTSAAQDEGPVQHPLTTSEQSGKLSAVHEVWQGSGPRPDVTAERRRALDVTLAQWDIAPLGAAVECREASCRYLFAFDSVAEMERLQRVPRREIEGELVVGRPEARAGKQMIAIYEVFQ